MTTYDPKETESWLICSSCGTQFASSNRDELKTCFICDDPRAFVPQIGQHFTTLADLRLTHKNVFENDTADDRLTSITASPKFGIGQRAILARTPVGNILWDCITLLDQSTIDKINSMGGLHAIVISHPHYYTTHVEWSKAFGCPVYLAEEDKSWISVPSNHHIFLDQIETDIKIGSVGTGVKAIKLGGHFPGSLVLLFDGRLFLADTIVNTTSGLGNWKANAAGEPRERPSSSNSYSFMWSVPNFIPLHPDEISRMWSILKNYDFISTHGAFAGHNIEDDAVKSRLLQSLKIQLKQMGWGDHYLVKEI